VYKVKVSIIVVVYNASEYIQRCINSVKIQTLKDIEIIIVNDGSLDNTKEILEEIAKEDSRIKVINKKNGGVSSARNRGLEEAQGEYIQHLDGDDWIEPTTCEDMYNLITRENLDIVVTDICRDDDNGNIEIWRDLDGDKSIYTNEEYLKLFFKNKAYHALWNKLYKRELYNDIQHPINIQICEDLATLPKLILKAKKIGKIDKAYYHYIVNPKSVTQNNESKKMYQLFEAMEMNKRYFMQKGLLNKYIDYIKIKEIKIVDSFITKKPHFNNKEYEKSIDACLAYLKKKPNVPNEFNFYKKIALKTLIKYPNRNLFKIIIFIASFLKEKKPF